MANPLAESINQFSPFQGVNLTIQYRDPTIYDSSYPLGQEWLNPDSNATFKLTSFTGSNAVWERIDPVTPPPETPNLGIKYFQTINIPGPQDIEPNTCYLINAAGTVDFQLPASIEAGNEFQIIGSVGQWVINQSGGQQIIYSEQITTPGSGTIASVLAQDGITIRCIQDDVLFAVTSAIGNLTVT